MSRIVTANSVQKNHAALLAQALPAMANREWEGPVILCDAAGTMPARRREDRLVVLEQSGRPGLVRQGEGLVRMRYHPQDQETALAALTAATTPPGQPVCADAGTVALLSLAERVARSPIPVLVEGPTGTGKEVLARFIHRASPRHAGPFVALNCAAMPEAMLEALLFGHRKGAFTGASEAAEGFFRAADGGTLLLDEIGEMPLGLQAKLLRALQEGEVVPLGATSPVKVDVRIIACTNRDLPGEIAAGRFREDLFYRLNVFPLRLGALRERPDDIAPLAFAMLLRHSPEGLDVPWISPAALARLAGHSWPGNIRELENVMRRAMLLAGDAPVIDAGHIRFDSPARSLPCPAEGVVSPAPGQQAASPARLSAIVRESEAQAILDTLEACGGHRGATARRLGISERTLRYRLASLRDGSQLAAGGVR